ncbi:MAG: hypothetical protein K8H88_32940 [Sandaracinaceae bacterium]|nr:hypothetical protein [Sandaracinaceae bacterium]
MLLLAPVATIALYLGAYALARGTHLLVHRHSIVGRFNQIVPGERCAARTTLCLGSEACWPSLVAIPWVFGPLIEIEEIGRDVLRLD